MLNSLVKNHQKSYLLLSIWTVLALIFNTLCNQILTYSYSLSQFPVPYFVGQLSFSASKLAGYYQVLLEKHTLPIYWLTQYVDFFFIGSVFLLHYSLILLIHKHFARFPKWKTLSLVMMGIALGAPLFDVLENLVSFVLMNNLNPAGPQHLSEPLAQLYSSFSALKFVGFMATYLWAATALVHAGLQKLLRR